MKTPEEWSGLILGLHYKSSAIPIIEQIQRDAREGMVPLANQVCAHCGKPASCFGAYEGGKEEFACDECCAHGSEDGYCQLLHEGMVPAEDVRPLIDACGKPPWKQGATERIWNYLEVLRAKHPNLFTK